MEIEEDKGENAPGLAKVAEEKGEEDQEKEEESEIEDGKWGDALKDLYEGTGIEIENVGILTKLRKENEKLKEEIKRKEDKESRRPRKKGEVQKKERSKSRRDESVEKRAKRPSSRQAKAPVNSSEED